MLPCKKTIKHGKKLMSLITLAQQRYCAGIIIMADYIALSGEL